MLKPNSVAHCMTIPMLGVPNMMMTLGSYRFSIDTAAYQSKERTTTYRWGKQDRLDHTPVLQFVGPGDDTINLFGVIYPHYKGGLAQVATMRQEASKGEPLMLVQGNGMVLGHWVIESITETEDTFCKDGAPKKIEFSLELRRFDRKNEPLGAYALSHLTHSVVEGLA